MFRAIVFAAVLAGVAAGLFATAVQSARVIPLIHEAETYEQASGSNHHEADDQAEEKAWAPEGWLERTTFTVIANVLAAVAFALLLAAAFALRGGVDWYVGVLWGLGGYAAFVLAPALGLPPEVPGAAAADLVARQLWWSGTALATALGLASIFLFRRPVTVALGVFLVVLPHLVGAPQPADHHGLAPADLAHAYVVATLVSEFLFWVVLGGLTGFFFARLAAAPQRAPA